MSIVFDKSLFRREPTADEITAARSEIHKLEDAIDILEERVQLLLKQVQQLRKEQNEHHAGINYCKGVITLARRIPDELLSDIFELCVEDGWTRAPLDVSRVCSVWRRAARAPRVWSHVYVNCDDANMLDRTRFWLSMARKAPLTISVFASWMTAMPAICDAMELLLDHASEWRTLFIDTHYLWQANLLSLCCNLKQNPIEAREIRLSTQISFDESEDGHESDAVKFATVFNPDRARRLLSVQYICNVFPAQPIFPPHIRELSLTSTDSPAQRPLSATNIVNLLESLPELRSLTMSMPLNYEHEFVPEPDPTRTVTLAHLDSLTLYGPTDLNELLAHLHTPALRRLHLRSLEDLGYRQRPIGPSLLRFVQDSAPPLELFELHDIDLSPETFAALFADLPGLRELRLHESSISDATVRLLHGPAGLCPRLSRLDLRWCGHLGGTALVELVRSRNRVDAHGEDGLPRSVADPIVEIGVINCCFVREQDVLDLAHMTVCRVVMRDSDDYCRTCSCCDNHRYRMRLRLRHLAGIPIQERGRIKLIV